MQCPKCGETLPFITCPNCGGEFPEKGAYCSWCGNPTAVHEDESEFSDRKLCCDGSCIGVINEKGVCNICGKPYPDENKDVV